MKKMSPRQQAIKNNDKTYEGRPCKEGHTTRSTKWRTCIECERADGGSPVSTQRKRNVLVPKFTILHQPQRKGELNIE